MATNSNDGETAANESAATTETKHVLSYFVCVTDAAGGYVGAILLTDHRARPLHFAYVQPAKPTAIQKILYGSTLDEHIKVDVIAQKLWQGLPKRPDVLFVESAELLPTRRIAKLPTAVLSKIAEESNSRSLSTIRYDTGSRDGDQSTVGEIVVSLEATCNLLEPFSRIRQALNEARKDKP